MTKTKGHSATHGGLRGHSIGSSYPYTVVLTGPTGKTGYVLNTITSFRWPEEHAEDAHDRADWYASGSYQPPKGLSYQFAFWESGSFASIHRRRARPAIKKRVERTSYADPRRTYPYHHGA